MQDIIFFRELEARSPFRFAITMVIERPIFLDVHEWACRATFSGENEIKHDFRGVDSWQAVKLSMEFLELQVQQLIDTGYNLIWASDKTDYN